MASTRFSVAATLLALLLPSISAATSFQYDELGRLFRTTYDNGTVVVYLYDESGNRTKRIVQNTESTYCSPSPFTRADMAIILEKSMNGGAYTPPPATGTVFNDVAIGDYAADYIEQLAADGITAGCGSNNYCPTNSVMRNQMAVFLLRARHGSSYSPPAATGVFSDVGVGDFAAAWIEQLSTEEITTGCGNNNYCPGDAIDHSQMNILVVRAFLTGGCSVTNGCSATDYCPSDVLTRAQAAVFILHGMYGSNYLPALDPYIDFDDVDDGDYAAAYIEQFALLGITAGCGNNNFCPNSGVTRAQMAVFVLRALHGSTYSPPAAVGVFADVAPGDFASGWIEQLAAKGITNGCGGGNFCPGDLVTRAEMAEMLVNAFVLQ